MALLGGGGRQRQRRRSGHAANKAARQNENKLARDQQTVTRDYWDQKYSAILQKLDDYQDGKDHLQKQVVDIELDEL